MTWRIDSEGTVSGEEVGTDAQLLYDRDEDLYEVGNSWWFTNSGPLTNGSWQSFITPATVYIYLPDFVRSGDTLSVAVEIVSAGTGGVVRLKDITSGNTGAEISSASSPITLTLTLGAWAGTVRQFEVQGYKTGGTLTVGTERMPLNVWFVSGG